MCRRDSTSEVERNKQFIAAGPEKFAAIDRYLSAQLATESQHLRRSHFFHGRYENIYLDQNECEALQNLLAESRRLAAELIEVDPTELSVGFWFNLMQPGQITDWHTHDDLDELVSGVVYLQVPVNSGNLILKSSAGNVELQPQPGRFVFFHPGTPHAVGENCSNQHRLSIGMNFGLSADKPD